MAKKKTPTSTRALTLAERQRIDQELTDQGLVGFTIERDGVTYTIKDGKMVPVSGDKARKAIGRGKKAKKA